MPIPTYIINLKSRTERRENVLKQFEDKPEFAVTVVDAIEHEVGSLGLWRTIKHILQDLIDDSEDCVLICEDDHEFTEHYSKEKLHENIADAIANEADILNGGVSWVANIVDTGQGLFWMDRFSGTQFIIIFKRFFKHLGEAGLLRAETADHRICELTSHKYFIFPFISTQREYGYSDATPKNNLEGRVTELFERSNKTVNVAKAVARHYGNVDMEAGMDPIQNYDGITIPTYIINLPERTDRREHIEKQFEGRSEFDVRMVTGSRDGYGGVGLWKSFLKAVQMAIDNDDDVMIVVEDDHEFTSDYSRDRLLKNIIEAPEQGIEMLVGGVIGMRTAVPIASDRYWVSSFHCTQFVVFYKSIFQSILDEPFGEEVMSDDLLSEIVVNKAVLFPFVSVQREFGYSDITPANNGFRTEYQNEKKWQHCIDRFADLRNAYKKHSCRYAQEF
jgi:GR25 family glycosyltransferase involved in LPS biosynthesis